MCGLKCSIRVVAIALIIQSGHLISTGTHNGTAEILWNLSHLAIQSRQNLNSPTEFQLHPERFSKYTGPIKPNSASRDQYGFVQNYQNYYRPSQNAQRPNPYLQRPNPYLQRPYPIPNIQRPTPQYQRPYPPYPVGFPKPVPALPPGYQPYQQNPGYPPQSFTEALQSVAQNDNLRCVPRLLCELTSGPSSNRRQTSFLPININMESLIGLLSAVSGPQTSGVLEFGKAVLLGYSSKGNTRSCLYAYPQCPQDPDRLVDYLNNYNGGFFRFFNGIPPQRYPQNPQRPLYPYNPQPIPPHHSNYYQNKNVFAEQRILSRPSQDLDFYQNEVRFPNVLSNDVTFQKETTVVFPKEVNSNEYNQIGFGDYSGRREKAIAFPSSDFEFQKPLPNLKQVHMIFPDRTGTGELRLDVDDVNVNYNRGRPYYVPEKYRDLRYQNRF